MPAVATAPVTRDLAEWYAGSTLIHVIWVLVVALWAFYISLAGRRLFRDSVLGEA